MSYKTPKQTTAAAVDIGVAKASEPWDKTLVGAFLAGAYIAFAGLLAIAVSSGLNPKTWGTLPTLFTGTVFALGLILVLIAGSDLLTGNMATVTVALIRRRVTPLMMGRNFALVLIGNLLGSLFVAYFFAIKSGVIGSAGADLAKPAGMTFMRLAGLALGKAHTETDFEIFLRAIGCNWLVCLAVWMSISAEDIAGKILAIFFPIMGFVAMGFDHVVANFFFLPAAIFAHAPGVTWGGAVNNWVFAFLGNFIGGGFFVGTAYWYLYLRGTVPAGPEAEMAATGGSGGAGASVSGDGGVHVGGRHTGGSRAR